MMSRVFEKPYTQFSLTFTFFAHIMCFMEHEIKQEIATVAQAFHLPSYEDIPDVGLYLEQTVKYVNRYLEPLHGMELTASMVSNYVKKGIIAKPVHKQYFRDQIAGLFFVAVAKVSMSMEDIELLFNLQKLSYPEEVAYEYFRSELKNVLDYVFGIKEHLDSIGRDHTEEKQLLRNLIIAVSHKIYLEQYLDAVRREQTC